MDVLSRRVVPLKTSRLLQFLRETKVPVAVTAAAIFSSFLATAQAQVAAKPGPQIAQSALAQIAVLEQEKRSRTPAQRKMSSQLIYASAKSRNLAFARNLPNLRSNVKMSADGKVHVEIMGTVTKDLIQFIRGQGGSIEASHDTVGLVLASLPLNQIETVAARPDVHFIRPAFEAVTAGNVGPDLPTAGVSVQKSQKFSRLSPIEREAVKTRLLQEIRNRQAGGAITNSMSRPTGKGSLGNQAVTNAITPGAGQGSVVSEGDATHRAAQARTDFATDGTGVKIGVISDGVASLATSQGSGDLGPVTVLPGQAGSGNEGTAMLEIVHDLAPGAELYFATAKPTEAQFAQNILDLRTAGCDIIVDDIIYLDESPFEDGMVAQAVNTVTADGALYFSSAGNEGNKDDASSGTWEGDFNPNGTPAVLAGAGPVNNFGDGGQSILVESGNSSTPVLMSWAEHYTKDNGYASTDYDVYVLNGTMTTIFDASTDTQDGSGDNDFPLEFISGGAFAGERIVIAKFADGTTSSAPMLNLILFRGELDANLATAAATRGHSAAANAFSVAASPAGQPLGATTTGPFPNPFTSANDTEYFSSDGPRRIILSPDGSEITPGNRTSTGGIVRQKPDITAADGVTTTVPGFTRFYGTSAAAPHAAAIAALIKSFAPSLTPSQVRTALISSAVDIEAPGVDRDTGAGIIMADAALDATGIAPPRQLFYQSNTVRADGGNGNSKIDPNECNLLEVTLRSPRLDTGPITSISGTLTTTTPGVTITQATSTYADLASKSTGTNTVPFQISTDSGFVCGTTIDFTLTVTSSDGTFTFPFSIKTGALGADSASEATDIPIAIPDGQDASGNNPGAAIESSIPVSGFTGLLGKATVSLYLTHTFDGDLDISLVAPDGTTVKLIKGVGGSGDNFGSSPALANRTILDDDAANPIAGRTAAQAPHVGIFRPIEPLSKLYGKAASAVNGAWKLRVQDYAQNDIGTLQNWGLTLSPLTCTDGGGACNVAGTTSDVTVATDEDTTYTFGQTDFDAGFDDPNGDFVQKIRIDSLPANGTLRYNNIDVTVGQEIARADLVNLIFVPAANFNGTTSFDWNGNDGQIYSTTGAQVICDVKPVNDAPTLDAIPDPTSISEDAGTQTVNLSGITAGPANESAQTPTVTASSSNTALIPTPTVTYTSPNATGSLSYTPVANANGTAIITVTVTDNGQTNGVDDFKSTVQTFTVTVDAVNDAPSFTKGANQTVNEDAGAQTVANWATAIKAGPADEAGQTLSFTVSNNNNSLFSIQPALAADGTLTYTPAPNANGAATVTVALKDNGGTANGGDDTSDDQTFSITVGADNDAPVANDQSVTTVEDTAKAITLTANDLDNASLTYSVVTPPAHGTLSGTAPNLTYTPAANYNGPDSFTFKANDGTANSNTATVRISVSNVNDAPVGIDDSYTSTGASLTVPAPGVLANDTDLDGDTLTAAIATQPAKGTVTLNADGSFTFTPAIDASGADSFTYTVSDGAATATATVSLTIEDAPQSPRLTLQIDPPSFNENAGPAAARATLTRNVDLGTRLTVQVVSSNHREATVPATVEIPSGAKSAQFWIGAVDDGIRDGNKTVTLAALATGYPRITGQVQVLDNGLVHLPLQLRVRPAGFSESDGAKAAIGEVSIPTPAKVDYAIELVSSDESEVRVPRTVTIKAGHTSATFYVGAVDDQVADGVQVVTLTAKRLGFGTANSTLKVSDDETRSLLLSTDSTTVREGGFIVVTLTRNWALNSAMTVLLNSSDTTAAQVPSSITIPAGAASGTFAVYGIANGTAGDTRSVDVTASRPGLTPDTLTLSVVDAALRASYGAASRVTLSTVAAGVATQSVALKFGAALNADAVYYADFAVLVNGIPAQIEGVSYDASSSTVTLLLAEGSLNAGEQVQVSWSNLLDAGNYYSQGQVGVVAR